MRSPTAARNGVVSRNTSTGVFAHQKRVLTIRLKLLDRFVGCHDVGGERNEPSE
jgi:hypothetical protein